MSVLYLIPAPLSAPDTPCLLPHEQAQIACLTDFVVENEKTARGCLKHLGVAAPVREVRMQPLNHRYPFRAELLDALRQGRDLGLLSEAGCPAVADPGADLVAAAHREGFEVRPLVGPSSILLALMASGANGQQFAFKGYLPADKAGRTAALKQLESHSRQSGETQIFIETPYRNEALLADALEVLHPDTLLCVACSLTAPDQTVFSCSIGQWRAAAVHPNLKKRPAIFVLHNRNAFSHLSAA